MKRSGELTLTAYVQPDDITEAIEWRHQLHRNPELGFEEHNQLWQSIRLLLP